MRERGLLACLISFENIQCFRDNHIQLIHCIIDSTVQKQDTSEETTTGELTDRPSSTNFNCIKSITNLRLKENNGDGGCEDVGRISSSNSRKGHWSWLHSWLPQSSSVTAVVVMVSEE